METDNNLPQDMNSTLRSLPFSSIIGAPLKACIEAQAMAAKTSWKFIEEVGLWKNPETGEKEIVNISFIFERQGQTAQVTIPLLTIIPVPYLAVETININFKANITASKTIEEIHEQTSEGSTNLTAHGKLGLGIFNLDAQFDATYSSKKDSKATRESRYSIENTIDVAIKAVQDDMPAGLAKLLEFLNEGIQTTPYQQ